MKIRITLAAVAILALATSCNITNSDCQRSQAENEAWIEQTLQQLTLDEKVALIHAQSKFSTKGVERLGIPELWWSDGPHGIRGEINWDNWGYAEWTNDSITAFPALTALAATFNPDLARRYGEALGEEALYRKKDVVLGPGVNIYRTPLNGRNFEYLGEDPLLASKMCVPYIKGMQSKGVAASVKHFALNNQEIDRGVINVNISERALREIYLPAFRAAIEQGGAWTIMGSYNKYLGQHNCHNAQLNKILKEEWQFDGVVVTDWGGAHDTYEAAVNGLDVEMGTWTNGLTASERFAYDNYFLAEPFKNAIKRGEIDEAYLDDKVRRVLRLMTRTSLNKNRGFGSLNTTEHQQTAHDVAAEAVVLLKNDNNILPIDPQTTMTIAVIGENATRPMTPAGGSSELKAKYEVSPLDGVKAHFPNARILHTLGYASGPSVYGRVLPSPLNADSLASRAVEVASQADLVIFVGGLNKSHRQDCEDGDRESMSLPFGQDQLIAKIKQANDKVVVVLVSGNAVSMPWVEDVAAIVQAWYLGNESGNVIGEVLCGSVNPSGKLPFSFPVKLEDNGAHSFCDTMVYPGNGVDEYYKEDMYVGYRWFDAKNIKPLFAFGHGLSYTSFEIGNVSVNKKCFNENETVKVKCQLSNTGQFDGSEVVQVYVAKPHSDIERVPKELKGFTKCKVASQAAKDVVIEFNITDLAYYDVSTGEWKVEKGCYELMIGNAADNIKEIIEIEVN